MARFIGKYSFSADGLAAVAREGVLTVDKPEGASVEAAFLVAASRYRTSTVAPDVTLLDGIDESAVTFSHRSGSGGSIVNYLADVTALLSDRIDAAGAGQISIPADYNSEDSADPDKLYSGIALTVIFADPNVEAGTTIFQFGHAAADGEETTLDFDAITTVPTEAPLSLGISWSIQVDYPDREDEGFSEVRISTSSNATPQVLTEYAGGYDDRTDDGAFNRDEVPLVNWPLVTVGGVGDSALNPSNPLRAGWVDYASDDELYNVAGFLQPGDTSLTLETVNPSDDDSIFQVVLSIPGVLANSTVTFTANTGSGSDYTQDGSGPTALSSNTFTKDGYRFTNWATNSDGSGVTYLNGATFPFTEDTTLFAQWEVAPASSTRRATSETTDSTTTVQLAATGASASQSVAMATAIFLLGGMTITLISMRLRARRSEG